MQNADDSLDHSTGHAGTATPTAPRRPLTALVVGLLALFCLLLAGLQGWSAWHAYHAQLEDSRVVTANMVRALALQAETSIRLGDAVLSEMVERIEHDGLDDGATGHLTKRLQDITHDAGEFRGHGHRLGAGTLRPTGSSFRTAIAAR